MRGAAKPFFALENGVMNKDWFIAAVKEMQKILEVK